MKLSNALKVMPPLVFILIYTFTHTSNPPEFTTIKVLTSDGYEMVIPQSLAFQSSFIKNQVNDLGPSPYPTELPQVTKAQLNLILRILKNIRAANQEEIKREDGGYIAKRIQPIIDKSFELISDRALVSTIRAANFLELEYLVNGLVRLLVNRVLKTNPHAPIATIFSFWFVPRDIAQLPPDEQVLEERQRANAFTEGRILPDKIKSLIEYHYTLFHKRSIFSTGGHVHELSIADYIAIHGVPEIELSEDEESEGNETATLDLGKKQITSLEGIDEIPNIEKIDKLDLSENKLVFIASNQFNKFTNLKELNLGDNLISDLPKNIFSRLTNLTIVSLNNNLITTIAPEIFNNLTNLTELNLSGNQLTAIPYTLFTNITKLEILKLAHTNLNNVQNNLFNALVNLKTLILSGNKLTAMPDNIFASLVNLERLDLNFNQINILPDRLFHTNTKLRMLYLGDNSLVTLPDTIFAHLTNLTDLSLIKNLFTTLPERLFNGLINLEEIDLKANRLTTALPRTIFNGLPRLRIIEIGDNPIAFTLRNGQQFRKEFNLRRDVTISYAIY